MDFTFSDEEDCLPAIRPRLGRTRSTRRTKRIELERHEDHDGSNFPHELWQDMADAGFFGIGIDEELGGQGGGATIQAIFMEEIARTLAGISWIWGDQPFNAKSIQRFASRRAQRRAHPADRRRRDARSRSRSPSPAPAPTCSAG